MIVLSIMIKDEESVICKTLEPLISCVNNFFIYDTGSTDNTVANADKFLSDHHKNFKIITEPFVNFAESRNRCLARTKEFFSEVPFILMLDAEWYVHNPEKLVEFCSQHLAEPYDFYHVTIKSSITFKHSRLFKTTGNGKFMGAVHEYVTGVCSPVHVPEHFYITYSPAAQGQKKSHRRWYRDLSILLEEYDTNKDPRTIFYLAQTYDCLGDVQNAIKFYKERVEAAGFEEERFIAAYRIGILYEKTDWNAASEYYLLAYEKRNTRIESLVKMAQHYPNPYIKYMYAKQACRVPYPIQDLLFVEQEMYTYHRWDQLAISAYYVQEYQEMLDALRKALMIKQLPHLYSNFNFLFSKIENKSSQVKVLNLILYSPEYAPMYNILSNYLKRLNIKHYFYCFRDQEASIMIENDIIYLKGEETFIPGILDKTLKVFKHFKDGDYDYIVRSNATTVVNFHLLNNWLYYNPCDYGGPYSYVGSFVDLKGGLTEAKHQMYGKYSFIGGPTIVLSKKMVRMLVENEDSIRRLEIIDHVSIGIAFNLYKGDLISGNMGLPQAKFNGDKVEGNILIYRNKREEPNRNADIHAMVAITNELLTTLTSFP